MALSGLKFKDFIKAEANPVFGGAEIGTCFDVYVAPENGRYRMDFSWRPQKALAVTCSGDGINWDKPVITLRENPSSGWEDAVNRNCVLKIGKTYKMWYTGQANGGSCIGYAESDDGLNFQRVKEEPVLVPESDFEKESVMNPCVLYDEGIYKMWYAAGETYEPNVLAYAESRDGISWQKSVFNPVFTCNTNNYYEKDRVGGCQVLKTPDMGYLMFYIGYEDINTARICVAQSNDGISNWKRYEHNPVLSPDAGKWDADSCYKPSVLWDENRKVWLLWYNGRKGSDEYIGLAEREGRGFF